MKRIILGPLAVLLFAAPASAQAPNPVVNVTVDPVVCKAHVRVELPSLAGLQVNVNNRGTQDDGRFLNDNGDVINLGPAGVFEYDFTLPKGQQYVIGVVTFNPRFTAPVVTMDCRNPLTPTVIRERVEVPVEVIRNVPGPERVVEKRVTVTKKVAARCYRATSKKTGRKVLVCPKPRKAKKAKCAKGRMWHPGVKRCVRRAERRDPVFTGGAGNPSPLVVVALVGSVLLGLRIRRTA
jgi:hypothetical protein